MVDDALGTGDLGDLIATLGSIDDDEIDWQNVARTTVLIHQTFRYEYPGPIASLRQRLIVVPPDYHDDQRLLTHKLRVSGCDVDTERSYDTFGNVVLDLTLQRVEREVEFTSWIVVEREAGADGSLHSEPLPPDARFSEPSRLTRPDEALTAVAAELEATGATGLELADLVNQRVHDHLRYEWEVTSVATTAAQAWAGGAGVCQDYAHCMLALARLCGLSARYVSGHLLGEGGTHAWVEVLVPHPSEPECVSAVAFDPTHARRAGLRYVTVAVGRDYARRRPDLRHVRGAARGRADDEQARRRHERRVPAAAASPPRRPAPDGLAPEQRFEPGQVPLAERGQAGVLDLVDEDRRAALEQPVVERAGAVALELLLRGHVRRAGELRGHLRRDVAAHEDQLERAVQVDDERRLEALDQRGQRLGLRLGARVRPGRRAVRPVRRGSAARDRSRADR